MISASDVLQIISEIHQYSLLLIELRTEVTLGILRSTDDRLSYFRVAGKLGRQERTRLLEQASAHPNPELLHALAVDQFLEAVEGKKARHIWLETGGANKGELGFLSIAELKAHFRTHARR